jgi:uncharacterized protein (DUF2141 family)
VAQTETNGALRMEVSSLRSNKGTLNCRLFSQADHFPDGQGIKTVRVEITGTQVSCSFDKLVAGSYAVAVVHDENSNGRLDKNVLGIPTEGYGVSNNRTYALSSPNWDESKFVLSAHEPTTLRVNLRY